MVTDVKTPAVKKGHCLPKMSTRAKRKVVAGDRARDARMYLGTCLLVSGSEKTWLQTRIKRSILNTVKNTPAESAFSGVP